MLISEHTLSNITWQAFERVVCRLLMHKGYRGVRLVGQVGDKGADIIANTENGRWLFQVKRHRTKVGIKVVDQTLASCQIYLAKVPVIVSKSGFTDEVYKHQLTLLGRGIPLQLWDKNKLLEMARGMDDEFPTQHTPRKYQKPAIESVTKLYLEKHTKKALVVMATGLGKTFVIGTIIKRLNKLSPVRMLAIAHTNPLVYQLEKSFWPFLTTSQETVVWNSYEKPGTEGLRRSNNVFACLPTVAKYLSSGNDLPDFDIILIDECHHAGASMYNKIIEETMAGTDTGPFLIGLTATPWRADNIDLVTYFGDPVVSIDIITGLKLGYLSNVDFRMYTDNINWEALARMKGDRFSPRYINRTMFIDEWDDAVVLELQKVWQKQATPRAIVFCGTIDHAITMKNKINALSFANAEAIYSQKLDGTKMPPYERNRILCDFHDGLIDIVCSVNMFNEGVDIPDVNILVFQRVTHSRRIFVQQLGRGLRISPGKDKVTVLDFVSDIRRFAAGLDLRKQLGVARSKGTERIVLNHNVTFNRVGGEDKESESFLEEWLKDIAAIEDAGEDTSVLTFPPTLPSDRV